MPTSCRSPPTKQLSGELVRLFTEMLLLATATASECFQKSVMSKSLSRLFLPKASITAKETMALRTALKPSKTTALRMSLILDCSP